MSSPCSSAGRYHQRLKLAHTEAALNGVPSVNFTFLRRLNVQARPFFDADHFVASDGSILNVPGLLRTSPSKIWYVARSDVPSETSEASSRTGSPSAPTIKVFFA